MCMRRFGMVQCDSLELGKSRVEIIIDDDMVPEPLGRRSRLQIVPSRVQAPGQRLWILGRPAGQTGAQGLIRRWTEVDERRSIHGCIGCSVDFSLELGRMVRGGGRGKRVRAGGMREVVSNAEDALKVDIEDGALAALADILQCSDGGAVGVLSEGRVLDECFFGDQPIEGFPADEMVRCPVRLSRSWCAGRICPL